MIHMISHSYPGKDYLCVQLSHLIHQQPVKFSWRPQRDLNHTHIHASSHTSNESTYTHTHVYILHTRTHTHTSNESTYTVFLGGRHLTGHLLGTFHNTSIPTHNLITTSQIIKMHSAKILPKSLKSPKLMATRYKN